MAYATAIRKKAEQYHLNGVSYKEISEKTGIAKSTLSTWFGGNPRTPSNKAKQREHLKRARKKAVVAIRAKRTAWIAHAHARGENEAGMFTVSIANVKALLAMLYWAEGSKYEKVSGLIFVNTDPTLLHLYMRLLRLVYHIDESRFKVQLHLHYYHKKNVARRYWSQTLKIPESQFTGIYVKKRSRQKRFRKNFQGICTVRYYDSTIREELLSLGRSLELKMPKQCLLPSFNG